MSSGRIPSSVQQANCGKRINTSLLPEVSRRVEHLSSGENQVFADDSRETFRVGKRYEQYARWIPEMLEADESGEFETAETKKAPVGAFLSIKFIAHRRSELNRKYWRDRAVLYPA